MKNNKNFEGVERLKGHAACCGGDPGRHSAGSRRHDAVCPCSGKETRKQIKKTTHQISSKAAHTVRGAVKQAATRTNKLTRNVKKTAKGLQEQGRELHRAFREGRLRREGRKEDHRALTPDFVN